MPLERSPSPRRALPLHVLIDREEKYKEKLLGIMTEQVEHVSPHDIKTRIATLKAACNQYETHSKNLSQWYSNKGSYHRSSEVRNARVKLIHSDCREEVKALNGTLQGMNEEVASSIGDASQLQNPSATSPFQGESSQMPQARLPLEPPASVQPIHRSRSVQDMLGETASRLSGLNLSENISVKSDVDDMELGEPPFNERPERQVNLNRNLESIRGFAYPHPGPQTARSEVPMHPCIPALDPISRTQLKHDLLRGMGEKFRGDCHKFWGWKMQLSRRLLEAEVDPHDSLLILESNTEGRVRDLISSRIHAGVYDARETLLKIWRDIQDRYGSGERVSEALLSRINSFSPIKNVRNQHQMEDLLELCNLIGANMNFCPDLAIFDLPAGMKLIYDKFPDILARRWRSECFKSREKGTQTPKFNQFLQFVENFVREMGMPGFSIGMEYSTHSSVSTGRKMKTLSTTANVNCVLHGSANHALPDCHKFKALPHEEKKSLVRDNKLCYKCIGSHFIRDCKSKISCDICNKNHHTLLHRNRTDSVMNDARGRHFSKKNEQHEEQDSKKEDQNVPLNSNCSLLCGDDMAVKVCSKTLLVEVRVPNSNKVLRCLAILDDQSNCCLCDPSLMEFFSLERCESTYEITTAGGLQSSLLGDKIHGIQVKGVTENQWISLPTMRTNPFIPDTKREIASSDLVFSYPHVEKYAENFPRIDPELRVLLLIGADCGEAMGGMSFGEHHPFVFKSPLGWSLVGPVCSNIDARHRSKCLKTMHVPQDKEHFALAEKFEPKFSFNESSIFQEKPDDDAMDLSRYDQEFLDIMSGQVRVTDKGNLQFPLPMKNNNLPDNKKAVFMRTKNTLDRLKTDKIKLDQCVATMGDYLEKDHIECVPREEWNKAEGTNYIPLFPISQKDKVRMVFDSSARYDGKSLNDSLLQGPDVNNRLLGVLIRFRHGRVGFSADIERMFHSFYADPSDWDKMRFYWWAENNPEKALVPYRSKVHVFGNKSSPAVATFGLRYTTKDVSDPALEGSVNCIHTSFYVDDLLSSSDSTPEAIDVLSGCVEILRKYNLRLHKICSNGESVLQAFAKSELASGMETLSLSPEQNVKALGLQWIIATDQLAIKLALPERPFSKRGILGVLNKPFDPMGIICPLLLEGKILQREILSASKDPGTQKIDWDEILAEEHLSRWKAWTEMISGGRDVSLSRCFVPSELSDISYQEMHVFCDASINAVGVVMYVRYIDSSNCVGTSFVYGSSKLSPRAATSIPRAELCGALNAVLSASKIVREFGKPLRKVQFYTDSTVVLAYLNNREKNFSKYVTARVSTILRLSNPDQWFYVPSRLNPADIATKPQTPRQLQDSCWLTGPEFLRINEQPCWAVESETDLPEERCNPKSLATLMGGATSSSVCDSILQRTNNWMKANNILKKVLEFISKVGYKFKYDVQSDSEIRFIMLSQEKCFPDLCSALRSQSAVSNSHRLSPLCPFMDGGGIVRVGGRLKLSTLDFTSKHPTLLPKSSRVTQMIIQHYHEKTFHQGRHVTMGALQQAGYHVHNGSSVVRDLIKNCTTCRRLRGSHQTQIMAELPPERLEECSPFTNVGVDVFGPYHVYDGKGTRRTVASKKIWGLLFTCLASRAVHVEPLSSLDITAFRLALRRFIALRGPCKKLISDQGTNFVGSRNQMVEEFREEDIQQLTRDLNCEWKLITPGASHAAGVWERKIGAFKRAFEGALLQMGERKLTRDEFHTLFAECASIVNQTPLYTTGSDPNDPVAISPQMILTLKSYPLALPKENMTADELNQYGAKRWRRVKYLSHQFWVRHRREHLRQLQTRNKWRSVNRQPEVNDVVLLRNSAPRIDWPIAKVIAVETGTDGFARTLSLKLSDSQGKTRVLRRCIRDTVLLIPAAV